MHLPDLTGRSVLDVGAHDGFYSFEAERRGLPRSSPATAGRGTGSAAMLAATSTSLVRCCTAKSSRWWSRWRS